MLAGSKFDPLTFGRSMANGPLVPVLLAFACAPNLRNGLERLARYKALFGPVVMVIGRTGAELRLELRPDGDSVELPPSLSIPIGIFVVEKARSHSAREINPRFVSLPANSFESNSLAAYFSCRPVTSDFVVLEFSEKEANTRFVSENESLWLEIERELEQQLQAQNASRSFHATVESTIRAQLYSGPTHADAVCDVLRISRSTLQRRLREEGYSFQQILDRVRFELAVRYLTKSDFSVSDIARMIGFMDPKSFFRAFRQRYGKTPEEYRSATDGG